MSKIIIQNTKIIDGTKAPAFHGHVVINGDRIEKILRDDKFVSLDNMVEVLSYVDHTDDKDYLKIDGRRFVLAPGFIDTHSHSDLQILENQMLEPKIRQGITTEVLGQDGIAMAPLPVNYIGPWRKNIAGLDGDSETLDWRYRTVENYIKLIDEAKPTSNAAYLVPHGNVRMAVMGMDDDKPTKEQLEEMKDLVREAMELGCLGLSSGLIYIPCAYSDENEIIELCKVVAEYDGAFVVHQRSEANTILESMDEIFRIGEASGVKIHFSHFKICGKNNWHHLDAVLAKLDEAKMKGIKVSFDQYPYTAGSTMLGVILPPWVHDGGTEKMLQRLANTEIREKLKEELYSTNCDWDNFVEFAGTDGIIITSVKTSKNKKLVGKSLADLGKLRSMDAIEATLDLLIEEDNEVSIIDYYGSEDHIRTFVCRDEMNVCTDGLLGGNPHPRAYGAFPRIIAKYVDDEKVLTLEEAINKMTYKPAKRFGMKNRGIIKEGAFADIVMFEEGYFKDHENYIEENKFPFGLKMVMVNGHVVFDGVTYNPQHCGRFIRKDK